MSGGHDGRGFFPFHCEGSTNEDCAQPQTYDLIGILAMWWDSFNDWSSAISWIHTFQERQARKVRKIVLYRRVDRMDGPLPLSR